jgi:diaminohydroxyphosphoribosylaminopyrimidine deaminase/5-amino-6-(5-phosphoribosylamino)uracil reductase
MSCSAEIDRKFMRRAIDLAMRGRGRVEPNPMVGCVIAKGERIIGEGFHERFGGPHAEPNALAACTEPPQGATAYVTLEPCCHTNKKTPPCVPALISTRIGRIVVGCVDPNPQVAGQGLLQLREAGIVVEGPVLEAEARQLIAPFIAGVSFHRPYVTLKWAESADGKVAGPGGQRMWISNERSRQIVHELRSRCDAVMVGIGTVLADDPLLTARGAPVLRPLLRVVLDRELRLPTGSRLANSQEMGKVIVYCEQRIYERETEKRKRLECQGIEVVAAPLDDRGVPQKLSLNSILSELGKRNVTHLLVEPGPTLAGSFLVEGLADRVWVFRSPKRIQDPNTPRAATVPKLFIETGRGSVMDDTLLEFLNSRSDVFFAPVTSADLLLM